MRQYFFKKPATFEQFTRYQNIVQICAKFALLILKGNVLETSGGITWPHPTVESETPFIGSPSALAVWAPHFYEEVYPYEWKHWKQQEAFEKCWAHSPQRAAARRITIHQVSLLSRHTPPAHRCPRRRRRRRQQQRQRQRVTEGTAMAPWYGPKKQLTFRRVVCKKRRLETQRLLTEIFVCVIVLRCWSYVGFTGYLNQTVSIGDGCQSVSLISTPCSNEYDDSSIFLNSSDKKNERILVKIFGTPRSTKETSRQIAVNLHTLPCESQVCECKFYAYFCKVFLQSFGFYDTIILLVS